MKKLLAIAASIAALTAAHATDDDYNSSSHDNKSHDKTHDKTHDSNTRVSKRFTAEVRTAVEGAIKGTGEDEQALAAAMGAFKISLDDAVLVLTKKGTKFYRLHTNSKYNGPVTEAADVKVYGELFAAAAKGEESVVKENSAHEKFTWDLIRVNDNVLVVCRHKAGTAGDDASKNFSTEVRTAVEGAIKGTGRKEQALAAAMAAFKVSLDDAILVLTRKGDKFYRMHTTSKYNGPVKDEADKDVYVALFEAAANNEKSVNRENASNEMFTWDLIKVNKDVLVVCRHK